MMAPKEVENLFYPQKNLQRKDAPLPDFQYYYDRIHAPRKPHEHFILLAGL